tara:strand:- start:239 stop:718 length:480 start_codon:yes stop_codon:yes gene_type:complete
MTNIIKNGEIVESNLVVTTGDNVDISIDNQLLPLSVYLENQEALAGRNDYGVWLDSDEEVELLEGKLNCNVIALNFTAFNDGRAYSSAHILRRRYGYEGEIRAIGDVRRDELEQMIRCGFDAFELADSQDIEASLASLSGFSVSYQPTADRPEPLFRRR